MTTTIETPEVTQVEIPNKEELPKPSLHFLLSEYIYAHGKLVQAQAEVAEAEAKCKKLYEPFAKAWGEANCPTGALTMRANYTAYIVTLEADELGPKITICEPLTI